MKVALYVSHEHLPFGMGPRNPKMIFGETMADIIEPWICRDPQGGFFRAKDHWIMPILHGLLAIQSDTLMAHVSFSIIVERKAFDLTATHNCEVQITTMPSECDGEGVPIVHKPSGDCQVTKVWQAEDPPKTPYGLIEGDRLEEHLTAAFWAQFFQERLSAAD